MGFGAGRTFLAVKKSCPEPFSYTKEELYRAICKEYACLGELGDMTASDLIDLAFNRLAYEKRGNVRGKDHQQA